jgi:FdhD protein
MDTRRSHRAWLSGGGSLLRALPEECAVAISYNGSTQAVMMATPADLHDFAVGFTLTEGLADPSEILEVEAAETPRGIDLQLWLAASAADRLAARRRAMAGPVGCGLCGIESLEEAMRDPVPLPHADIALSGEDIMAAMAALPAHQPLHDATRAAHAAGFWRPGHGFVAVREDVGRHNALDKLAGAMVRASAQPADGAPAGRVVARAALDGAVIITSRVSVDMVQKAVAMRAPVLVAASAPTAAALRMAQAAGLTLVALARPDRFETFTHPHRITGKDTAHVA